MSERIGIAATDGVELAGERWPGERKQIVLLHAGVADRRSWARVADELGRDGFDVLAYDRRGFGETPATGASDHVADLRRVLAETARAPVLLVGNSQGGRIALDLASTEPDRIAGLVLIAPAISGRPDPEPEELDEDTLRTARSRRPSTRATSRRRTGSRRTSGWTVRPGPRDGWTERRVSSRSP